MAHVVKWQAPTRARERLMVFGMAGVGKTLIGIQWAEKINGNVWIIETDNTYDEMLESRPTLLLKEEYGINSRMLDTEFCTEKGTVYLYRPRDWKNICWAIETVWSRAARSDLIIFDNGTMPWDEVQTWYVTTAYGKSVDDFMVEVRTKQIAKGKASHTAAEEMFTDWGAINPQYFENVKKPLQDPPCHLYVTAEQAKVDEKDKDKANKAVFGPFGVKPKGQKSLGHTPRTVLLATRDNKFGGDPVYELTTVKDRERDDVVGLQWGNFFDDFIKPIAGWKPIRVEVPE